MTDEKLNNATNNENNEIGVGIPSAGDLQTPPTSKAKGRGDIVFVIDVTSSMQPCIYKLKESLANTFFNELDKLVLKGLETPDWRIKIVTYKDLDCPTDTEPKLDLSRPFVSDKNEVINQINDIKVEKYQGCDPPESTLEALYSAARKSEWRPKTGEERVHRVIVVLTDAPPKETFNKSVLIDEDKNALFDSVERMIETIANVLADEKVKTFLYGPEHKIYEDLSEMAPRFTFINVGSPDDPKRYEGLKNVNFDKLMDLLVQTISE